MTTGESLIDYEALTQNAMRSVVHTVLARTANSGLPGDHHFYISFDTHADGVSVSKRLKEKYAHEMTIVLQHRFWDLNVYEERFEVKLTFDGIPERLVVPYTAIKVFFDPSVRYGLQFEDPDFNSDAIERTMSPLDMSELIKSTRDNSDIAPISQHKPRATTSRKSRNSDQVAEIENAGDSAELTDEKENSTKSGTSKKPRKSSKTDANSEPAAAEANPKDAPSDDTQADNASGAEIVSLDAFRKK